MADEQQDPPSPQPEPAMPADKIERAEKASKEAGEKPHGDRTLGEGSKYGIDNSERISEQNIGDGHTHYHYTTIYNGFRDAIGGASDAPDDLRRQQEQGSKKATAHKNPFAARHSDNTSDKELETPTSVPQTDEEVADWYSKLTSYSQCFVQAMAIFEGATIPEIAFATNRFYEPIATEAKKRAIKLTASVEMHAIPLRKLEAPDGIQFKDRLRLTHVKIEASSQSLVWQDDENGPSPLRMRLLQFLAFATPLWHDSDFLARLEVWTASLDDEDENSSRALWTQGAIWWWQDPNRLSKAANEYSDNRQQWYRASYLLYGAYVSHRFENESAANDHHRSRILQCISSWSQLARKKSHSTKGCAAALTYMLIGIHALPIALKGLDHLLELPWDPDELQQQREQTSGQKVDEAVGSFIDIYESVIVSYCGLTGAGYTREILQHSAQRVEKDSHHRIILTNMKYNQREHHRDQRAIRLIAALDTFFRIAQASLENVKYRPWVEYDLDAPLPEQVDLANTDGHGREVILTGVLNGTWTSHVCTLLCAALMEKSIGDFGDPALKLLREWADFVLKDQGPHPDRVRQSYVQFLVQLDTTLQSWSQYWTAKGYRPHPVTSDYRRRIQQWGRDAQPKKRAIARALVEEVLLQLPS